MADPASQIGSATTNYVGSLVTQPLWFADSVAAVATGLFATTFAGFKWFLPREMNLMNLEYSSYTYYTEEISSGIVERQGTITVTAMRELSFINTYTLNIVTNNMMIKKLKEYAKAGNLFILITPVGIINDLALERLDIVYNGTNPNPIFVFKFKKLLVSNIGTKYIKMDPRSTFCI